MIIILSFIKTKLTIECTKKAIMMIGNKSNSYVIRQEHSIYINNLKTEVFSRYTKKKKNCNKKKFYITNNCFSRYRARKKNQVGKIDRHSSSINFSFRYPGEKKSVHMKI